MSEKKFEKEMKKLEKQILKMVFGKIKV